MPIHTILSAITALIAVIALILLSRYGAQKFGLSRIGNSKSGNLFLHSSINLDGRRRISLIECSGRQLLILTGGPSDVSLGWLPPSPVPAQQDTP